MSEGALPSNYADSIEEITDPVRVAGILKRIHEQRTLLTLKLPDVSEHFLSAVLEVGGESAGFVIDELMPKEGNPALLKAQRLHVLAQCQGVEVSFSTTLAGAGRNEDGSFYRLALPTSIRYHQKRADFRVRVSRGKPLPVELSLATGEVLQGLAEDISYGGIGAEIATPKGQALEQGQLIEQCKLKMSREETVEIMIEVRFARANQTGNKTRIGARFLNLGRPQERAIRALVATLEREWLKKNRRE
jgi:c-di-GMP-binding flagellar brake protein YcgR